eukprot:Pgem_evm1s8395
MDLKVMGYLLDIHLDHNKLVIIHEQAFQGLELSEVRMRLDKNQLDTIPNLYYLPRLFEVNLSSNKITTIEQFVFKNNPKIISLDLSNNNINDDFFQGSLEELAVLNLSYNNIDKIPSSLSFGHNLMQLDLSGNNLVELDVGTLSYIREELVKKSEKYLKPLTRKFELLIILYPVVQKQATN